MILAVMVTEQCNFLCGHCMISSSREFSIVSDRVLEKYFGFLERERPDEVYLMGGEPFLHIDTVEKIVGRTKPFCERITVFSNGSFLMSGEKSRRVKEMGVQVRISDDSFHREKWPRGLEEKIEASGYWIARREEGEDMIPVGRAYEKYKHLQYNMGCSLLNGNYDGRCPNRGRCMIMLNGDMNLYCATVEAALANVFEDENITYGLLVEREKILHNYLFREVIRKKEDTYMAVMCNLCPGYKVTAEHIFYRGEKVADCRDYMAPGNEGCL